MNTMPREDDQDAIMRAIGPALPILLREIVDSGFHNFAQSRKLDPDGYAEYTDCTKANMLYDRIASVGRELVAVGGIDALRSKQTKNKRATDWLLDPHFAFRIKRVKGNRGGRTTGVSTRRRTAILSGPVIAVGQQVLPFAELTAPDEGRLWLTVPFDLDAVEESVSKVSIGVERRTRFLWKRPLPVAEPDIVATLDPRLAERVLDLRDRRLA